MFFKRITFYRGISVFWLALWMLFDGINSMIVPARLLGLVDPARQASTLGLLAEMWCSL